MEALVSKSEKGNPITTSLLVAQKFNKEHKNVLRDIRYIIRTAQNSAVISMFYGATYYNEQSKEQPMFVMNRDGFTLLVMGYTGKKALKLKIDYISAFNAMEQKIKNIAIPQNFADALELAARQYRELEQKEQELEEAAPKVLFANSVAGSKDSILVRDLSRFLHQNGIDIGQNRLYEWLRDNNYVLSSGASKNKPSQKGMDLGLFELKEGTYQQPGKDPKITFTTMVTSKGQQYFIKKFLSPDKKTA